MKKNNNKGFSMVELLAAIAILGLLSAIAVVGISSILNNAEKNHYETQEKNMIMAVQSYAQDNRNVLPKEIGDSKVIEISNLQSKKYIGKIVDRSKNACSSDKSTVTIFKYSKDGYSYKPYLECDNYKTKDDIYGIGGPNITVDTSATTYVNPSFKLSITKNSDEDTSKVISYSYQVYKSGVLVHDSGSVAVSGSSVDNKKISLKNFIPGNFTVVVSATNNYGEKNSKTVDVSIIDANGPDCELVTPDQSDGTNYSGEDTTMDVKNYWVNINSIPDKSLTFDVKCRDDDGSGCVKDVYSQKFNQESATNFIDITDKDGNITSCTIHTYIDNTPPVKPTITNPEGWINEDYEVKAESSDDTSGVAYFKYKVKDVNTGVEEDWVIQYVNGGPDDISSFTSPLFTEQCNKTIEIQACDYAGNCSESEFANIQIDKTNPTITISLDGTMGPDGFYVSVVTVKIDPQDEGGSGVDKYGVVSSTTVDYNMLLEDVQPTVVDGIVWYGYVMDGAGNTAQVNTEHFVVKADPPEITFSLSGSTSTATCVDGLNGEFILEDVKDIASELEHTVTCSDQYGLTTIGVQKFSSSSSTNRVCGQYSCGCPCNNGGSNNSCGGTDNSTYKCSNASSCCSDCVCSDVTTWYYSINGDPTFTTVY